MIAFRVLLLIAIWCCPLADAAELVVAVGVQDPTQIAMQDQALAQNTPGFEMVALNDDIAREICRRMNTRCTLRYVAFAEVLPGIENRHFDIGFGNFLRSPERESRVAYSDTIWHSSSRLLALTAKAQRFADKLGQAVTLDNLRDARVVVVDGSQQSAFIRHIASEHSLTVIGTSAPVAAVKALHDDTADFTLLPIRSAYALLSHGHTPSLQFVGPAVADRGLGGSVHIIFPISRDELRRAANQAIAAIRADGTLHRMVRKYFPLDPD
jgi:ABC-type amino acid transport substrate-binding protein